MPLSKTVLRCIFWLIPALVLTHTVPAQQGADENLISIRFSCLSLDDDIEDLKFLSANETEAINIYDTTRSKIMTYRGVPQLTFFREQPAAESGDPPIRIPVGQVTLDGKEKRYLLFFIQRSAEPERYNIFAIPDNTEDFKAGTYRFINLASFKVAVKIGETRTMLKEQDFTDISGDFEHGNYYQTIMVSLPKESDPVPAYSGRVYFSENTRMLYIIRPKLSGRPGKIRISGFPERL